MFDDQLFQLQDTAYRDFQAKLIPNIDSSTIIGVRVPQLRRLARQLAKKQPSQCIEFLNTLPHHYYEENLLHAYLITDTADFARVVRLTQQFLPFIDNWAVCDTFRPKSFGSHTSEVLTLIQDWLSSNHPYTIRFAIGLLLSNYLNDNFNNNQLRLVASVKSNEYYVKMMQAWYFATALAKQPDATMPYLTERRLQPWVHNKAIQKACESYRINNETKKILRQLRCSA